jgi:hypothetical protein
VIGSVLGVVFLFLVAGIIAVMKTLGYGVRYISVDLN